MKREVGLRVYNEETRRRLTFFAEPRTPRQAEIYFNIKKIKLKPYIDNGLLNILNENSNKGRLYLLRKKGRKILNLPTTNQNYDLDWELIGWLMASPKQRLSLLKIIGLDKSKRTSENIRYRASKVNSRLTRIEELLRSCLDTHLFSNDRPCAMSVNSHFMGVYSRKISGRCLPSGRPSWIFPLTGPGSSCDYTG